MIIKLLLWTVESLFSIAQLFPKLKVRTIKLIYVVQNKFEYYFIYKVISKKIVYLIEKHLLQSQRIYDVRRLINCKVERRTEIEKQNILLYNKMSQILNRSKSKSQSFQVSFRQAKLKVLNRINEENKEIVKRIENQKPTISNKKMFQESSKRERYLKFIGSYPYRQKYSSLSHSVSIDGKRSLHTPTSGQSNSRHSRLERRFQRMGESFNRKAEVAAVSQVKQIINKQDFSLQPSQCINLYRKMLLISGQVYEVQINRLHHLYQFKLVDDKKSIYRLALPERQGDKVLTDFDYDFSFIVSCLKIVNNQLTLNIDKQRQVATPTQAQSSTPKKKQLFNHAKLKGFTLQKQNPEENPLRNLQDNKHNFSYHEDYSEECNKQDESFY